MKNTIKWYCMFTAILLTSNLGFAKSYKSAEIYTQDAMLYGKYVFRMQASKGSGIISNFFLWKEGSELSNVFWEEVDFEVFGKDNAMDWQSNIITGEGTRITSEQVHSASESFADAYHTFTLEWAPDYLSWSVDGVEVRRSTGSQVEDLISESTMRFNFWPPNIPEWVGPFDDSILPVHMFVNWIEYHRWDGSDFVLDWRDDFDSFDTNRWVKASHTFAENLADFVPENALVSNGYLVLAMTHEGQEGYNGTVPTDDAGNGEGGGEEGGGEEGGGEEGGGEEGGGEEGNSGTLACSFVIENEWDSGYLANISLTNSGDSAISDWEISWSFNDGESVLNSWNAIITGTYSATALAWNNTINPGQSVSFGAVVSKANSGSATAPSVTGDLCQ